jgi:tetratricopeptide (TPR) repeat protein
LSSEANTRPPRRTTENPEAYQAYLEGRFFWNKRTTEGFRKSIEYFQRAVEKDPKFALAYAGLADAYLMDDAVKAESALRKALELDNTLGEAHASLGFDRMFWNWDWGEAEREFKLAITTTPNYATAHQWYGIYLAARGRLGEAKSEMKQALELDPLSPIINTDVGQVYYFSREYDQAVAACRKALEIDPDFIIAHQYLYHVYTQLGMYSEAVEEFLKYATTRSPAAVASLRHAYALSGWRGFLQNQLDYWEESKAGPLDRTEKAVIYGKLGHKPQAIEQLERAYDERNFFLVFLKVEPRYDDLSADSRFQDLLQRVGLTP